MVTELFYHAKHANHADHNKDTMQGMDYKHSMPNYVQKKKEKKPCHNSIIRTV